MSENIVQTGNLVLREKARAVPLDEIPSRTIQQEIKRMHTILALQRDGVALAAPQIDISKRIFVIAPKAFKKYVDQPLVFINPVITKKSKNKTWLDEGCLSVRWQYGKTHRHKQATVEAYNEHGIKFEMGGSGLIAQIFQHEIDHLDGTLFIDHAKDVYELTPDEIKDYKEKGKARHERKE